MATNNEDVVEQTDINDQKYYANIATGETFDENLDPYVPLSSMTQQGDISGKEALSGLRDTKVENVQRPSEVAAPRGDTGVGTPPAVPGPAAAQTGLEGAQLHAKMQLQTRQAAQPPDALNVINQLPPEQQEEVAKNIEEQKQAAAQSMGVRYSRSGTNPSTLARAKGYLDAQDLLAQGMQEIGMQEQVRERQAIAAEAAATAKFRELDAEAARQEQENAAQHAARVQELAKLKQQRIAQQQQEFDDAVNTFAAMQVDPDKFWNDRGTGRQILGAISMAMGAFASNINGGPNYAMQIIENAIERDIAAQRANIDKQGKMIEVAGSRMTMTRQFYQDQQDAEDAYRASSYKHIQTQLQNAKATYMASNPQQAEALINMAELKYLGVKAEKITRDTKNADDLFNNAIKMANAEREQSSFAIQARNAVQKDPSQYHIPSAFGSGIAATISHDKFGNPMTEGAIANVKNAEERTIAINDLTEAVATLGDVMANPDAGASQEYAARTVAAIKVIKAVMGTTGSWDTGLKEAADAAAGKTMFDISKIVTTEQLRSLHATVRGMNEVTYPSAMKTLKWDVDPEDTKYRRNRLDTAIRMALNPTNKVTQKAASTGTPANPKREPGVR